MSKIIWIDTETTGLSSEQNGLREVGYLIEIDGKIVDHLLLYINPNSYKKDILIDNYALEISNKTIEDLNEYPDSSLQFLNFIEKLEKYIYPGDKKDKFQVSGYNTSFDTDFLKAWFKDNDNNSYSSYFSHAELDTLAFARKLSHLGCFTPEDHKLPTLCKLFNIPLEAHNALNDIEATKHLDEILSLKYLRR